VSKKICGLSGALSVRISAPVLEPAAVGENVTLITQLVEGGLVALTQSFVWEKAPLATMLVNVSDAFPELVTVTACEVLLVPTD
jgi:hypothetical protein